ncbi:MAG: hypothetical protein ACK5X3_05220 [Pseudomonadota bacterium]
MNAISSPACMMFSDDDLLQTIMSRPGLLAQVANMVKAKKPKIETFGNTPKQKAAFARLSPERQQYIKACDAWRSAWRAWRYFGGAHPGAEPVDMVSVEALAWVNKLAELDRMTADAEARLMARWGGDVIARDEANATAPIKHYGESEAEHAARVREHLNNAAAAARAKVLQTTMASAA